MSVEKIQNQFSLYGDFLLFQRQQKKTSTKSIKSESHGQDAIKLMT